MPPTGSDGPVKEGFHGSPDSAAEGEPLAKRLLKWSFGGCTEIFAIKQTPPSKSGKNFTVETDDIEDWLSRRYVMGGIFNIWFTTYFLLS
jgi:hypothetical protein